MLKRGGGGGGPGGPAGAWGMASATATAQTGCVVFLRTRNLSKRCWLLYLASQLGGGRRAQLALPPPEPVGELGHQAADFGVVPKVMRGKI